MTTPIPAAPVAADAGRDALASGHNTLESTMGEPRYTIRDDADLCADLGVISAGWIDIFDGATRIACCYMGTHEQNLARAEAIVDILNAHDAAAINGVLAQHRTAEETA